MKCGKGRDTRNVGRKKYTQYGSLEITRDVCRKETNNILNGQSGSLEITHNVGQKETESMSRLKSGSLEIT